MKKSFALFAASLLLLSACTSPFSKKEESNAVQVSPSQTQEIQVDTQTTDAADQAAAALALNEKESKCKDSGGTFSAGTCTCPSVTYGNVATPIFVYNGTTGYCEDPDGVPGGVLGTDGKGADL